MDKSATSRQVELGNFLRSRRERSDPLAFGIVSAQRRRTPGLRREEVAGLAGIGIDWYIRLEQGRNVSPSPATIDAIADALRLGPAEHDHLRSLVRGLQRRPFVLELVPESLRNIVEGLDQPAYVTGRRLDLLAWNAATADLFTDFGAMPKRDQNLLAYVLINPHARSLFGGGWTREARHLIAMFRVAYDQWAGDPAFSELHERLQQECPEYTAWWKAHDVRLPQAGVKLLDHATRGKLCAEYATFQANVDPALKFVIFSVNAVVHHEVMDCSQRTNGRRT